MKKLNASEAQVVIGGVHRNCTTTYEWVSEGVCNSVKSCPDKHGNVKKYFRPASESSCKAPGFRR